MADAGRTCRSAFASATIARGRQRPTGDRGPYTPPVGSGRIHAPVGDARKVVTVLFCDLVGFTAASEDADPEDVRARIDPYFDRLAAALRSYGGTVEKYIGDAVQGVFGAPVTHEDDPERAVRAALRILDEIADLNRADPDLALVVRIGVHTGEGLIREGPHDVARGIVTGDVANTASRLQTVAPEGGIVVSESTYLATERVFGYQAMDPVVVKGKSQPIPIWRVIGSRARLGTDITRAHDGPMVGRDRERGVLRDLFDQTVRDRSLRLVTIVGEPGMGKSRIVAELAADLDALPDPVRWRQGRCLPYGDGITFWALGEIVKAEAGILETDPPDVAGARIDAIVPDEDPDAPWLRQRLRPLIGLDAPGAGRDENFAAWRRFLASMAERIPAVVVFEDLHWADIALLAFIERLSTSAVGVPLLIIATTRPELFDRWPTWASGVGDASRIDLAPLSEGDTARLIGNLLGQAVLPTDVQATLLSRSSGNPLFAGEFVRLLRDRRILALQGSTWTLDPTADIPVPSEVHGLIAARLDTLDPADKALVQDAAVIGQVFWSGAVADMAGLGPDVVERALRDLSHTELIRPAERSSMEGQTEYAFAHALIRDVCYAQIPRAVRAERHRAAAAWIERVSGERVVDNAEILASHYTTALELTRATRGGDTADLEAKALRNLAMAGDRAFAIDVEVAERHFARAVQLTPPGHQDRPRVLVRYAEALRQRGRFPDAVSAYEEAIEGFRAQGDVRAMGAAMGRFWIVLLRTGDPRAPQVAADAVAALEPMGRHGPTPELVQALTELAGERFVSNDYDASIAYADRAIALSGVLELPEPARPLGFRGASMAFQGDADGLRVMRHARTVAADQGLGREVALLYNNLSVAIWPIEGVRAWLGDAEEGLDFAERRGIAEFTNSFAATAVQALVDLGSYDQAMALAEDLVPRLELAEDVWELVQLRSGLVRVHTRRGTLAEAATPAAWIVEKARDSGRAPLLAQALPVAAVLRLAGGDAGGARAILAEFERTRHVRTESNLAANLPAAVRTAIDAGDPDLAGRLAAIVEPIYPLHVHALTTARALLREHEGSHAEAADLFADAATRWASFGMPWERAEALCGQARCLGAMGRPADAAARFQEARGIFAELGAGPAVAVVDDLLDQAAALASPPDRVIGG